MHDLIGIRGRYLGASEELRSETRLENAPI